MEAKPVYLCSQYSASSAALVDWAAVSFLDLGSKSHFRRHLATPIPMLDLEVSIIHFWRQYQPLKMLRSPRALEASLGKSKWCCRPYLSIATAKMSLMPARMSGRRMRRLMRYTAHSVPARERSADLRAPRCCGFFYCCHKRNGRFEDLHIPPFVASARNGRNSVEFLGACHGISVRLPTILRLERKSSAPATTKK